jgi:hypothetical protein
MPRPLRTVATASFLLPLLALLAPSAPAAAQPTTPVPPDHRTAAELDGYRSTASLAETVAFLKRLEATSPYLSVGTFGTSGEGRPIPFVVVSKEKAFAPAAVRASRAAGKPVVLLVSGIHAGEIDGKEASSILLREVALGNRREILDAITLVVVPVYNVDGHERVSPYNRPNQDGPVKGMGFRTTTAGLDLNRDALKADAAETRALLSLVRDFPPDLVVDQHVTDGADVAPVLTVSYGAEPATPKPLGAWLDAVLPKALSAVEAAGFPTGPYVEWVDPLDPAKGIDLGPSTPRYLTCYFPLRGVPAILVENHAMKPFATRVRGNAAFLDALLGEIARAPKPLLEARARAGEELRSAPVGSALVLDAETDLSRPAEISFPAYAWKQETSLATGRPTLVYDRSKPVPVKMPLYRHAKAKVTAARPAAYVVPAGWHGVAERLEAHGIPFTRLDGERTLSVGTYRAARPKFAASSYQGRVRVSAEIVHGTETRIIPSGSLYVPLDDELAAVAMHLLEPEGPDSLFAWGEWDSALEGKEYIEPRVLDPLAKEILEKDPKVAAEWAERLKDPKFAADPRERMRFFWRRTPFWDEATGLLPVYRLEAPLAVPAFSGTSGRDAGPARKPAPPLPPGPAAAASSRG